MLLEERCRAPEDRVVHGVAQVGDHSESGVADEVGACVVENSLEQCGSYQGEGDDRPGILKAGGNKLFKVEGLMRAGDGQQLHLVRRRGRIQDAVKNGADEEKAESIEKPDGCHQDDRGKHLPPVRGRVPQEAGQLPHKPSR